MTTAAITIIIAPANCACDIIGVHQTARLHGIVQGAARYLRQLPEVVATAVHHMRRPSWYTAIPIPGPLATHSDGHGAVLRLRQRAHDVGVERRLSILWIPPGHVRDGLCSTIVHGTMIRRRPSRDGIAGIASQADPHAVVDVWGVVEDQIVLPWVVRAPDLFASVTVEPAL